MIEYPTIYKQSNNGKVQVWKMIQDNDSYVTVSGQKDSPNLVTTKPTICEGKNLGKKNETSGFEQAKLEIEAQYRKKLSQGNYKESIEDIDEDNYFEPMLAKKYEDYPPSEKDFKNGVIYSQPKLDGMRMISNSTGLWSRQGKTVVSVPHIQKALESIFKKCPELTLDGELYNHDLKDDFNQIMSLSKQSKPTKEDLDKSEKMVQYHVYDCCDSVNPFIFSDRFRSLNGIVQSLNSPYIKLVEAIKVKSQDELDALYSEYITQGYEGQIVRIDGTAYENKRTKNLLKRKEFQDDEFPILRIEEGIGNRSGLAGKIICLLPNGNEVGAGIRGNFEYYQKIYDERSEYIGGQAKIRYFGYTDEKSLRFPVAIQLYKTLRDD